MIVWGHQPHVPGPWAILGPTVMLATLTTAVAVVPLELCTTRNVSLNPIRANVSLAPAYRNVSLMPVRSNQKVCP